MINGLSVLAIIPARGGSKGVPRKNIKDLAGKPLIAWTIDEAKKSRYIDKLILSSEDEEIISVAKRYECGVPLVRPKELAEDDTPGVEPVMHAISNLPNYDVIVLLQPTSPLRIVNDIDKCIEKFAQNKNQSCVSVVEVDKTPYWMYKINSEDTIQPIMEDKSILRRQDAPKVFALNGAVYVSSKANLIENYSFLTKDTVAFVMPKERSYDIDTLEDFLFCELLLTRR